MAKPSVLSDCDVLARQMVGISHLPSLLLNVKHDVIAASDAFCVSFKVAPPLNKQSLADFGSGEWDTHELRTLVDDALNNRPGIGTYEMSFKQPDVEPRRLRMSVDKIGGQGLNNYVALLSIEDITDIAIIANLRQSMVRQQKDFIHEKAEMVREQNLLLEEMRHRIANSLIIIASILLVKARGVQSEESRRHLTDAHDRVLSIAAIQDQLREGVTDVEVGPYLTKLCASLATSLIGDHRPIYLRVDAEPSTTNSRDAVSIGLVVTELVINALKHAFPDGRAGSILVRYRKLDETFTLSVQDDGVGMPRDAVTHHVGLGTSIISTLAKQLHAVVKKSDAAPGTKVELVCKSLIEPSDGAQNA